VVYQVINKEFNVDLGIITWYTAWRQYIFKPNKDTVYSIGCMIDIARFVKNLMDERKKKD
jgi:hypothetical protein